MAGVVLAKQAALLVPQATSGAAAMSPALGILIPSTAAAKNKGPAGQALLTVRRTIFC
jgi:hypothetical protein